MVLKRFSLRRLGVGSRLAPHGGGFTLCPMLNTLCFFRCLKARSRSTNGSSHLMSTVDLKLQSEMIIVRLTPHASRLTIENKAMRYLSSVVPGGETQEDALCVS
jgi:hypothetical protein